MLIWFTYERFHSLGMPGGNNMVTALIIKAQGTNCDEETAFALTHVGARAEVVYVNRLLEDPGMLEKYHMVVTPGGFSYGDDIAAGRLLARELSDPLRQYHESGGIGIYICNGCQVSVEAGYVPGRTGEREVAFTDNIQGHFREITVPIRSRDSRCLFIPEGMEMRLPIAHGEGRYEPASEQVHRELVEGGYVVFEFSEENPNGSRDGVAGITNTAGNILAMMPHPERAMISYDSHSGRGDGYEFWKHVVNWVKQNR